jgi:hypothetical protein
MTNYQKFNQNEYLPNLTHINSLLSSKNQQPLQQLLSPQAYTLNQNRSDFAIGKVISVKPHEVHMKIFDADGKWLDGHFEIPFRFITSVTFDSRYCNQWENYLKNI